MPESTPASAPAIDRDNPWPGLATFTEDQRPYFHGRDEEILDLTQLAERRPLVVLFGQSGLGKSSILQAGVFPRLRTDGFCPIYIRLDHADGAPSPTEQIKAMVRTETAKWGTWTKPGAAKPGETLWEFFHHRDDRLIDRDGLGVVPVLVFDQFEELFTLGAAHSTSSGSSSASPRERAVAFIRELAELVENRPSAQLVARLDQSSEEMEAFDFGRTDYRVIISLREDFLPDLETLKTIMPALMQKRMRLSRMTGKQALEAVLKPGGALVTEDVARAIVEFVAGARGGSAERLAEIDVEPALLSVVCRELNERRRTNGQAKITLEQVSGDRREILTDFYERSVADLPAPMRAFVEDHLLTKSGFRDNLALETALEFAGVTRSLIDTLVSRRLLRIEDRIGTQRVELTHDVLADVIRAARDTRQQRETVELAARRTRRLRWAVAGLGLAVVGLCIGAFFGIQAQRLATEQASRGDLLLGSRLLDEGKFTDGLAYLVSAARKDPTNEVLAPRILASLAARNFLLPSGRPLVLPSPGASAFYAADGRRIFVQSEDGTLRAIDPVEWRIERELTFDQKIRRAGIATAEKNSEVIAVVLADNTILVVDASTGTPRSSPIRPPGIISGRTPTFGLSPDGRWVAAAGAEQVWLWDAGSGELRATLPAGRNWARDFVFSPDSSRIVTTHGDLITQIWSVPDGRPAVDPIPPPPRSTGGFQGVNYQKFSADGRRLLIWYYGSILVCDAGTGLPVRPSLPSDGIYVNGVELTPDGGRLGRLVGNRVEITDVLTGNAVFPPLLHGGPVFGARFVGDGKILATNSVDGLVRLWDLETGRLLAEPTFKQEQYTPAAISPDGRTTVLFTASGQVFRQRLGSGAAAPLVLPRFPSIRMASFMPKPPARLLWFTTVGAKAIDVASGREAEGGFKFPVPLPTFNGGNNRSRFGGTTGPGLTLFVRPPAGELHAWTLGESGVAHDVVLAGIPANVNGANNAMRYLVPAAADARVSGSAGPTRIGAAAVPSLGLWDVRTGQPVTIIDSETPIRGPSSQTVLSPDETRVAFQTTDQVVHVCEVPSGRELFTVQLSGRESINTLRFSPSGAHLLTGGDWGGVQVWDAASGNLVKSTQAHRTEVGRFDFSADGRYYASSSADGSVQVWNAVSHVPVGPPLLQSGAASRTDFSPDGARIVTPSTGGTARVWDVRSGLPLTDALDHRGVAVGTVAYSPDGRFVSTQANAGGAKLPAQRLWAVPPDGRGVRTPEWLLRLATICAGQRLNDEGKFVIAADEMATLDEVRREVAALPVSNPYAEWAQWFLSDSPTRSIAPGFTITPAEARQLVQDMTRDQTAAAVPP
jgi:WD40 repeat protein